MKYYSLLFFLFISCNITPPNNSLKINLLLDSGNNAYANNNWQTSIGLFTKLINLDSNKGEYYFKRGYSYSMILNANQAIMDYKKAITLKYRIGDAQKNIGVNYSTINDSLAIVYFTQSLKNNPTERQSILGYIEECSSRLQLKHSK